MMATKTTGPKGSTAARGKMLNFRKGEFPTKLVAKLLGLNLRTVLRWVNEGTLQPRNAGGEGKGAVFAWGCRDILAARLLPRLKAAGLSKEKQREACALIVAEPGDLADKWLITNGETILIGNHGGAPMPQEKARAIIRSPQAFYFSLGMEQYAVSDVLQYEQALREGIIHEAKGPIDWLSKAFWRMGTEPPANKDQGGCASA